MVHIFSGMARYHKKKEISAFVTAWMDLERVLCPVKSLQQRRKMLYDFTGTWNLKKNINKQTKLKQTHRHRERAGVCQTGAGRGDG